jgi:HAD superfamily hydrolase (TIGR01549 family)
MVDSIIFDLDNTLYNYDKSHNYAIQEVMKYLSVCSNVDKDILYKKYIDISFETKDDLFNTASSHVKMIYFRKLSDIYNISSSQIHTANCLYWKYFFKVIEEEEGVYEFLEFLQSKNIKMNILTDYTIEKQYEKLDKLNLLHFFDKIITSEEVGIEKPNSRGFKYCLDKTGYSSSKTFFIGDNYEKDIAGSIKCGMTGFHYVIGSDLFYRNNVIVFGSFNQLTLLFKSIYKELDNLTDISRYCGERFDLTQAAGGNTSVKVNDDIMIIKSSGVNLSDISLSNGYSILNNVVLRKDVKDNLYNPIESYNTLINNRASMETYMHSILKKYTVHLHPIQVNTILIQKNYKQIIYNLFGQDVCIIDYKCPGVELSSTIFEKYKGEKLIFLQNHGIIITTDDFNQIKFILEDTLLTCEKYLNKSFESYKFVNNISETIKEVCDIDVLSLLSEYNYDNLLDKSFFPDKVIFCGHNFLNIKDISLIEEDMKKYYKKYKNYPSIIIAKNNVYIAGPTIVKCREIESVLKSHYLMTSGKEKMNFLSDSDSDKLTNLESEIYRKNLK